MIIGITNFGTFKKIISKMKMILNEPNFIFRKDGLYIKEIDIGNENLIYLYLSKDYFDDYIFSENITYRVNLFNFYNCLKTLTVKNKLYLDFSNNNLKLSCVKEKKTQSYYIEISKIDELISSNKAEYNIVYHNIFEIDYCREHKIEDMGDFLFKDISIEVSDKRIILETKNEDIVVIRELMNINFLKCSDYKIRSIYKFSDIKKIFSFLSLGSRAVISINNNSPIKLEIFGDDFNIVLVTSNTSSLSSELKN